MKIIRKFTDYQINPKWKGRGGKKFIEVECEEEIPFKDIIVFPDFRQDGQIEKIQAKLDFLLDMVKLLYRNQESREIVEFFVENANKDAYNSRYEIRY